MSYSRQINETDDPTLGKISSDRLLSDVKDGITVIRGYTLSIRQIALSDLELTDRSVKVLGIVREGKRKIQEISKKLNIYSKRKSFTPVEETQKRHAVQQLSRKYLEAVKNFEDESKNYMNQISMKINSLVDVDNSNIIMNTEDDAEVFDRTSSSAYDSSREKIKINIYDYNWGLDKYEQLNNDKIKDHYNNYNNYDTKKSSRNNNSSSSRNRNYGLMTNSDKSIEFQSIDSTFAETEKKKFKKNPYVKGSKYKDANEYLLLDELHDGKLMNQGVDDEFNYQEKKFVSVNTMDIENEILKQKNKEIKKLHKDIINIQELYKELSEQINVQGENLDNIDSQIVNTHQNIVMSGREIQITRYRYARNSRCLFFILFFLLLLIVIIMVVFKIL